MRLGTGEQYLPMIDLFLPIIRRQIIFSDVKIDMISNVKTTTEITSTSARFQKSVAIKTIACRIDITTSCKQFNITRMTES